MKEKIFIISLLTAFLAVGVITGIGFAQALSTGFPSVDTLLITITVLILDICLVIIVCMLVVPFLFPDFPLNFKKEFRRQFSQFKTSLVTKKN